MQPVVFLYVVPFIAVLVFMGLRIKSRPTHAGGIVFKNENGRKLFLLVSSTTAKNKWVFPKGHIEKNETAEFAAVREVLEEAGVFAKPVKRMNVTTFQKKGRPAKCVYFVMMCTHEYGTGLENREVLWMEKTEAMAKLGSRNAGILEKAAG